MKALPKQFSFAAAIIQCFNERAIEGGKVGTELRDKPAARNQIKTTCSDLEREGQQQAHGPSSTSPAAKPEGLTGRDDANKLQVAEPH